MLVYSGWKSYFCYMICRAGILVTLALLIADGSTCQCANPMRADEDEYVVWGDEITSLITPSPTLTDSLESILFKIPILGESEVDMAAACRIIYTRNPNFEPEIAEAFYRLSPIYGIRADLALCQSIIETGWFKFTGGTAVTAEQHNYCGLGVTERGVKGMTFETIDDGVRAQLQHLYAYATIHPLPPEEPMLDPRFHLVARGCAKTWHDLAGRWAMNPNYGKQIADVYTLLCNEQEAKAL